MPKNTYGDWCVPPESLKDIHSKDPKRTTDGTLISTAYFCYDLQLLARTARLLGKPDDAQQFSTLAEKIKIAFNKRYLNPKAGRYDNGTQTSSVLPLAFDMVPAEYQQKVFDNLITKITTDTKGHIGTGLIGGQFLMRVLSDNGRPDVALGIAQQKDYPGWGYMIAKGATTIWELWNGDTANPAMNSGNHVMLVGDLTTWLYEYLGGIRPDPEQPGFKHIILRPVPVGDLTSVRATHQSPYGKISSAWKIENGEFLWSITVPANTTATVYVPTSDAASVTVPVGAKLLRTEKQAAVFAVESGSYAFTSRQE
jgi:alpha-L-rhamnosidase